MTRSPRSGSDAAAGLGRWLRADVRDVVRIAPSSAAVSTVNAPAGPRSLTAGLDRWRARLSRVRFAALLRRQLTVGCAAGVVVDLVALATGGGRMTRILWLALPAAITLLGLGAGLRRRLATGEVARLLDHDLSLAERVATAVEVGPEPAARGGLAALVRAQAGEAVASSLGAARVVLRPARVEWLGLAVAAAVLAVVVALPSAGSGASRDAALAAGHRAPTGAPSGAAQTPTVAHTTRPGSAHAPSSADNQSHRPPPLSFGNGQTPSGASRELARGPSGGKSSSRALPKQVARGGNGGVAPRSGSGSGQSGASGTAGSPSDAGGQASNRGGAAKSGGSGPSSDRTPHGGAGRAATGAKAGRAGSPNAPGAAGSSARSSGASGASGAFKSRHSPPGGDTAGGARGTTRGSTHASNPRASSNGGLPIQSGYTPSSRARSTGRQGSGPAVAGGSGRARAGAAGGGPGTSSASFPFIAPTPNAPASADQGLLLNYFGPFSRRLAGTW